MDFVKINFDVLELNSIFQDDKRKQHFPVTRFALYITYSDSKSSPRHIYTVLRLLIESIIDVYT